MKISIIIPVYNKHKYLSKLFEMLICQTYCDFECILIDDGSNDGSESMCDLYMQIDNRFIVVHKQNGGVSSARNVGLELACGEYITFVDSDDEIRPDYLENLYTSISSSGSDMVIGSYEKIQDGSDQVEAVHYDFGGRNWPIIQLLPHFAKWQKETGIFGWCWGKIIKREIIGDERFNITLRLAEDFDFYLKVYPKISNIYIDNECIYRYRIDSENGSMISAADDDIDYYSQLLLNLRYRDFLIHQNSYTDQNRIIVEQLLSNYSFFTLLHTSAKDIPAVFEKVYTIWISNQYPLIPYSIDSKVLLWALSKHYIKIAQMYVWVRSGYKRIMTKSGNR